MKALKVARSRFDRMGNGEALEVRQVGDRREIEAHLSLGYVLLWFL